MGEGLKPCPFCGGELITPYLESPDVYTHAPSDTCFARHAIIHPESYAAWNRRTQGDQS